MFGVKRNPLRKLRGKLQIMIITGALIAMTLTACGKGNDPSASIKKMPPPTRAEVQQVVDKMPSQKVAKESSIEVLRAEAELKQVSLHLGMIEKYHPGSGDDFNWEYMGTFLRNSETALEGLDRTIINYIAAGKEVGDENAFKKEIDDTIQLYMDVFKEYFNIAYENIVMLAKLGKWPAANEYFGNLDRSINFYLAQLKRTIPPNKDLNELHVRVYGMLQELNGEIGKHERGVPHDHPSSGAPHWTHTPHPDHWGVHKLE